MARRPDNFIGLDLTSPPNRVPSGRVLMASNSRAYGEGQFEIRNQLSESIITLDSSVQSFARMNDATPDGPVDGYAYIGADTTGQVYVNDSSVGFGFSGNPVSIIAQRPNASVQPWAYIGDNSENVTIHTRYALNDSGATFDCFGQVKVRSDGLIYKTGIQEPSSAPTVTNENENVEVSGILLATAIPWTNYLGANPNFNYGESNGEPSPTPDGTAPFVVNVRNASTVTINSITGTATINGGTKTPTSLGPSTGVSTNPGHYIQILGSGGTPATATVVTGAFIDASGNVMPVGVAPLFIPSVVDIGAAASPITIPTGAVSLQIGINSTGNTFSANSGSFNIDVTVTTDALPPVMGIVGNLSLYDFGDSPTSGPVASYIWRNPDDPGGGTTRTISGGSSIQGNSFIFDANFVDGVPQQETGIGTSGVAPIWFQLNADESVSGTITLPAYANFNFCLFGRLYIPEPGNYDFVLSAKDAFIWGIEGATVISATAGVGSLNGVSQFGQTITVAQGYPLLPIAVESSGEDGFIAQVIVTLNFAASGVYGIEIDYDYWYHGGRVLLLTGSPTPGGSGTSIIPPISQGARTGVSYAGVYRSSLTGAQSNPSPLTAAQTNPVLASTVSLPYSPDPQVDKCDYYRQDEGLPNYTYVATGPNTNPPTPITDALTDLEAADNQQLVYTNYEPVPSIDLPQSGHCTVSSGVITTLDTPFNIRWLPGTVILIGYPTQLPYTFISRPISTTQVEIPGVPDGTNLVWNIAEPTLANQPLPYQFGPTDSINYVFAVGDPLRQGTLYWCSGSNMDAWPQTNQFDMTDPSEALVNGAMSRGRAVIFSIKRGWVLTPNFFNALATVTGTSGSTWTPEDAGISRGLFIPRCLIVQGGGKIFFRVDDGIHVSNSGIGSQSITDDDLYPLFSHEGSVPAPISRNGVIIYPPNDSLPERQKFSQQGPYLYYDFIGTDGNPHTLVYDTEHMGWVWDSYDPPATIHASNQGESQQGNLVGCADGSVRLLTSGGEEAVVATVASAAFGGEGWMHGFQCTVEYSSKEDVVLSFAAVDEGNESYAPNPVTLPPTGGASTKYTFKINPNKWLWLQLIFTSSDPDMAVYLDGLVMNCKAWGSAGEYKPIQPFRPNGGHGGQV